MAEEEEEKVACPIDTRWLEHTKRWMPPAIWETSKLSRYDVCLKKE